MRCPYISLGLIIFFMSLYACKPLLYVPTASTSYNDLNRLQEGRSLYVAHCGSCHALYLPQKYNETQWSHILDDMQKRAKIDDMKKDLIYKYLLSAPINK